MHLPKISHLNAIYFKMFAIWLALVHVALRFMLWFCWYLNWKKNIVRFTVSVYFFLYTYILCEMRIFTFARAFRVRAYYVWDPETPLIKHKPKWSAQFLSICFFCVQSKQCGNGKTNVIANLHRQWCSHSISALSHQLPAPFCKLSTHHQMRLLLIDGFFPFQFNQMSNDTLCRQFACYLLRSLCYWFSKLFFYYLLSLEKFYDFQGNSKYQANQLVAIQPASTHNNELSIDL